MAAHKRKTSKRAEAEKKQDKETVRHREQARERMDRQIVEAPTP